MRNVKELEHLGYHFEAADGSFELLLRRARVGAPHSVVFGGFSAESLRDRINDATARVLITADGGYRRGSVVPLNWVAGGDHAPYFYAQKMGWYKQAGLDVTIMQGGPQVSGRPMLLAGKIG